MPNGQVARLDPSFLQRLAALGVEEAQALTGNVSHVPGGISVQLTWHHSNGAEDPLTSVLTNAQGQYQINLPPETPDATTCRLMVSVGDAGTGTLTRAFVFSTTAPVDIDFASEAVVRMILARVSAGDNLCSFPPATIQATVLAVRTFPGSITGVSPQQLNSIAVKTATAALSIQATLGPPGPTPTNTMPPSPTSTLPPPTATRTVSTPIPTATSTNSPPPPTATPTNSVVPTATNTVASTATFTASPLPTATLTSTSLPTQTPVPTATFTGSPLPTATLTDTSTPIATATNTPSPTATNTSPPTATNTPLPTATPTTPGTAPQISIGSTSGMPGNVVSIAISLTKNGPNIVTIAPLVFTFDPAVLTFDSCTSDASGKNVDAVSPASGHVSMVISGGLATIPDGAIAHCGFTIADGAPAGASALSFLAAGMSDANQTDFTATGTSGVVTVTGVPTATRTPTFSGSYPTPTETASVPRITIGSSSGTPGSLVSVAIWLTNNGRNIVTIAPLAFTFDPAVLTFNSCTSDVSGKNVDAVSPSAGHVSMVVSGGLATIPDGAIAHCSFTIAVGAPTGASALSFLAAGMSDANQTDFTATGTSGAVTVTGTVTATPTPASVPRINIGFSSATRGSVVSVSIWLTKNGPSIVTIAPLVFTFDPTVLTFGGCTSDVSGKNVDAVTPSAGHVSMVMSGGLAIIGDGTIADCTFTINTGAALGLSALSFVEAGMSDANQNDFTATGSSGAVTVLATPAPTSTLTPAPTTSPSVPRITIGSASGAPGGSVTVFISLAKNGPAIVTIAPLVFTFDPAVLTFGGCTSDTSGKTVDAVTPSTGHVSLVMSGGLATIPDGAIAHCAFTINGGASLGASALSFVEAGMSDASQTDFTATGVSGSVTVTTPPTPTATPSGPQIIIGTTSGSSGNQVTVSIALHNNGASIVTIAPAVFGFDPTVLTFSNCVSDVNGKNIAAVSPSSGHVSLVMWGGLSAFSDGTVADCSFTINSGAPLGASALPFVGAGLSDASQTDSTASGISGSVTVLSNRV
ncbi:MAG: cohesin domain-containing protein [Candidatus Binatia bacterium]